MGPFLWFFELLEGQVHAFFAKNSAEDSNLWMQYFTTIKYKTDFADYLH